MLGIEYPGKSQKKTGQIAATTFAQWRDTTGVKVRPFVAFSSWDDDNRQTF